MFTDLFNIHKNKCLSDGLSFLMDHKCYDNVLIDVLMRISFQRNKV